MAGCALGDPKPDFVTKLGGDLTDLMVALFAMGSMLYALGSEHARDLDSSAHRSRVEGLEARASAIG
jgi:hypothetical protein